MIFSVLPACSQQRIHWPLLCWNLCFASSGPLCGLWLASVQVVGPVPSMEYWLPIPERSSQTPQCGTSAQYRPNKRFCTGLCPLFTYGPLQCRPSAKRDLSSCVLWLILLPCVKGCFLAQGSKQDLSYVMIDHSSSAGFRGLALS